MRTAEQIATAPFLRLVPPADADGNGSEVVAEILADGTIRPKDAHARSILTESKPDWATGQIANGSWILWWQRRQTG